MQVNAPPGEEVAIHGEATARKNQEVLEGRIREATMRLKKAVAVAQELDDALNRGNTMPDRTAVQRAIGSLPEPTNEAAGDSWCDRVIQGLDERRATQSEGTPIRDFLDQRAAPPRRASSHRPIS